MRKFILLNGSASGRRQTIRADSVTFEPGFVVFRKLDGTLVEAVPAGLVLSLTEAPA